MTGPAAELAGVSARFGKVRVLDDVNLSVEPAELVGILGPSGAGKTTILRLLLGELRPSHGHVRCFGRPLTGGVPPGMIGYVPQIEGSERGFPLTAAGAVELGLAAQSAWRPWFSAAERRAARDALERLGIGDLHARRLDELSGGQFQRVLVARALVARPRLLLLDEPTSGVDLQTRSEMLALLEELRAEGLAIVLTTHDLNWVAAHLPRLVCLNRTVVADGPPAEVLEAGVLRQTFGAEVAVISHAGRLLVTDAVAPVVP
jgi:ABC-type Mn2+/Zn2+ transport system ATPase subunit